MTLSDLASVGSLASSLAVLVSLIFLYIQVRQSAKNQRAAIRQAHSLRTSEIYLHRSSPEQGALWVKAMHSDADLSDEEIYRCLQTLEAVWFSIEDSFYQHREGLLDDEAWRGNEAGLRHSIAIPFFRASWPFARRIVVGADFVTYVDGLMAQTRPARGGNNIADYRRLLAEGLAAADAAGQG